MRCILNKAWWPFQQVVFVPNQDGKLASTQSLGWHLKGSHKRLSHLLQCYMYIAKPTTATNCVALWQRQKISVEGCRLRSMVVRLYRWVAYCSHDRLAADKPYSVQTTALRARCEYYNTAHKRQKRHQCKADSKAWQGKPALLNAVQSHSS